MHVRARLIGTIAVSAALLVPIARADSPYDWPGGIHRPSASALAAAQESSNATHTRPDDRAGVRGPGAFTPPLASTPSVVAVSRENGFDWGDAVVGAAVGMGAAILFIGCAALLVSQRSRARPA